MSSAFATIFRNFFEFFRIIHGFMNIIRFMQNFLLWEAPEPCYTGLSRSQEDSSMNICIYGASSNQPEETYFQAAEQLGWRIAEAGHTLVFGGGRDGLMAACARGTLAAGGRVIGIAPQMFLEPGFLLESCTEMLLTENMAARKEKMLAVSDAFITLPGGIGTMDEFFETVTLKQLGLVDGPLVLLNTADFYAPLIETLRRMAAGGFMSENCLGLVRVCDTPEEALDAALRPETLLGSLDRLEK